MRRFALIPPIILALACGGCTQGPAEVGAPPDAASPDKRPCSVVAVTYSDPGTRDESWSGGIKDFCLVAGDNGYHLFHITDPAVGWNTRDGELTFGHATTSGFATWTTHDRIDLRTEADSWSPSFTWAPHVVFNDANSLYYMFYTGVKWNHGESMSRAQQRVGLAVSYDLFHWYRYDAEGRDGLVLDGPDHERYPWSAFDTDGVDLPWEYDCRDPFVFDRGAEHAPLRYVMLNSIRLAPDAQQMAIAFATSPDLLHWEWLYHVPVTVGWMAESASLVEHDGDFYLFWTDRTEMPSVRVACSTGGIFGDYELVNGGQRLFGFAAETLALPDRLLYAAFDDSYMLHIKRELRLPASPGPEARVRLIDFTACDEDWPFRHASP
ncbi:MAG: hypothetical protein R3D98_09610 [Candidatus Krumholzibacteriia bacterium]